MERKTRSKIIWRQCPFKLYFAHYVGFATPTSTVHASPKCPWAIQYAMPTGIWPDVNFVYQLSLVF
jgi:hypothetical protein